MNPTLKFAHMFGYWGITLVMGMGFFLCPNQELSSQAKWPDRYSASYRFEISVDHNGLIIVSSIDSTSQPFKLGIRPGMELLGWNTLPIHRRLESMNVKKYRKLFPTLTDENIRLILLPRGRPGETAEVFFMTSTGNNRGIRIKAG